MSARRACVFVRCVRRARARTRSHGGVRMRISYVRVHAYIRTYAHLRARSSGRRRLSARVTNCGKRIRAPRVKRASRYFQRGSGVTADYHRSTRRVVVRLLRVYTHARTHARARALRVLTYASKLFTARHGVSFPHRFLFRAAAPRAPRTMPEIRRR